MKKLKDKKITIIEEISEYIPGVGQDIVKRPLKGGENIWAYYRQASGDEKVAAQATALKVDAIFEISWRNDLDTTMIIQFRGEEYDISRIDDYEGYKSDLRIYASIKRLA